MKIFLIVLGSLFGLMVFAFLTVCIISYIENRKLKVSTYQIASKKLNGKKPCHFVVLADLHNAEFGTNNERLLQTIRDEQPDFVVIAGDMFVAKPKKNSTVAASFVEKLAEEYTVYYGYGNHELRAKLDPETYGSLWQDYFARIGNHVQWMDNCHVSLKNGVQLYGLNMDRQYYKRLKRTPMEVSYLEEQLGKAHEDDYKILIAHDPDYMNTYEAWGADLVLSGHLHGGMVRLPLLGGVVSPAVRFFPRFDRGKYHVGNAVLLLSGGLGNHTFKFRVNNIPEILSVTICGED